MANVLLGVTGSVAAIRTPELFAALRGMGHAVKVVATDSSLYFFNPAELDPQRPTRNLDVVVLDEDEWPGRSKGANYRRDDPVLHIELRKWAEVLAIAPLDANTLAKLANGLSDNCLTCVWRAWDPGRPVVLAPAMNTLMWEHRTTVRHLRQVAADAGGDFIGDTLALEDVLSMMNHTCPDLRIVPPQSKKLACGDVGVGAMAEVEQIVEVIGSLVSRRR